jgi:hypothetical protein
MEGVADVDLEYKRVYRREQLERHAENAMEKPIYLTVRYNDKGSGNNTMTNDRFTVHACRPPTLPNFHPIHALDGAVEKIAKERLGATWDEMGSPSVHGETRSGAAYFKKIELSYK